MKRRTQTGRRMLAMAAAAVLAVGCVAMPLPVPQAEPEETLPYMDTSLSFEERAADLVSRMTLEEKASQLGNDAASINRLGVSKYNYWSEALHGVARSGEATSFPYSIAMAATWDPELIQQIASATSDEARGYSNGKGKGLSYWSPTINMARDPRWGRNHETYGEDPFLTTQIGSGFVKGMQGDDEKYLKTIATIKHYAANNSEYNRHNGSSNMDDRTLREYYTRAFKGVERQADVASVMSSYNRVNEIPASANTYLLDTLLRRTFGFDGYVTSDCGAIQNVYADHKYQPAGWDEPVDAAGATAVCIQAGTDIDCGSVYKANAVEAVQRGLMSEDDIDLALVRLFTARMQTGEFDPAGSVPYRSEDYSFDSQVENAEHTALAESSANEAIVLLKNEAAAGESDPILPLDIQTDKNIVMLGEVANKVELSDYSGTPSEENMSTPIQGMEALGANVTYIEGGASSGSATGSYICNMKDVVITNKDGSSSTLKPEDAVDLMGCRLEEANGNIGYILPGASLKYEDVDVSGIASISLQVAGDGSVIPGDITVTIGSASGMQIASVETGSTGGWQTYKPLEADVTSNGGATVTDLYLSFNAKQEEISFTQQEEESIRNADAVIVCLDGNSSSEGRDRSTIMMPQEQAALATSAAALNDHVIVYIQSVGMMEVGTFADDVQAILWTSFNGQAQGNAMARVICGEANPTAKLPFTWYAQNAALPTIDDYDIRGGEDYAGWTYQYYTGPVTYPFGYGLSYSSYEYSNLKITSSTTVTPNDTLTATVDVKNTSNVDGEEIVQLYVAVPNPDGVNRPFKQLKSFEKVAIAAGETKTVTLTLDLSDCYFWDEEEGRNVYDQGEYTLFVGPSSDKDDEQMQKTTFTMDGELTPELAVVTATADRVKLNALKPEKVITTSLSAVMNDDSFYDLEKGDATVSYESSNEAVATVDNNGIVHAVNSGVATITASVTIGGKTLTDSFPVVVTVELESIQVNGEDISGFSAAQTEYRVPVDPSPLPVVTVPGVPNEYVSIQNATSVPGDATATIQVGDRFYTYTLHFIQRSHDYVAARFSALDGQMPTLADGKLYSDWKTVDGGQPVDFTAHDLDDLHLRLTVSLRQTAGATLDDASAYGAGFIKLRSVDDNGENNIGWNIRDLNLHTGINYVDIPLTKPSGSVTGEIDWQRVNRIMFYFDGIYSGRDGMEFEVVVSNAMVVDVSLSPAREELWQYVDDGIDEAHYTEATLVPYRAARETILQLIFRDGEVTEQETQAAIDAYLEAKAGLKEETYLVGTFSQSAGTYTVLDNGAGGTLYNNWKDGDDIPYDLNRDRKNLRLQLTVQYRSEVEGMAPGDIWSRLTVKLRSSDEPDPNDPNNSEHNIGWDFFPQEGQENGTLRLSIDLSSTPTNSKGQIDWSDIRRLIVLTDLNQAARDASNGKNDLYSMVVTDVKIVDLTNILAGQEQIRDLLGEVVDTTGVDETLVAAYNDAKAEAEAVCATEMATPAQIYYAHVALQEAIEAIKDAGGDTPSVDKAALDALITQAQQVDTALYTDATAGALETALRAAEEVAGDDAATQTEVNDALAGLQAALDALQMAWGDIDATDGVSASDALMALQAATEKVDLTAAQQTLADVDGQKGVSANDALMILQHATQKIASFPVESNA